MTCKMGPARAVQSPLPEFRLETYFSKWEFAAKYHLTASDAESLPLDELLELADAEDRTAWEKLRLGYVETRGTPRTRKAIAATYDTVHPDDVLSFAGAEEGIYCAMLALLRSGDHAVVTVPNYQSMESLPLSICDVSGLLLDESNNWDFDVDHLRSLLRPNTRLIAVNFPNNPTGKIASRESFEAIVSICRERDIFLFSDEVYRGIERDPLKRLPQAADLYERALSLNVLSKSYGLPGLRVGWIACRHRQTLDQMALLKSYLSITNAAPSECLASIALKAREQILGRNRELTGRNLQTLSAFFSRHADLFEWYEPDGSCVAYPRYLGPEGVETFCTHLVEEAGVFLLPASIYRSDLLPAPADRFRIGYGRFGLEEGLAALEIFLGRGERQNTIRV